jgi:predicted metal-dependent phosphoesterase TrpH
LGYNPHVSIDLHIHSTASDGTLTPEEIVARACRLGLEAIAITDHDTVTGVHQLLQKGIPQELRFLTGVEVSTAAPPEFPCRGSLHLLGYGFRPEDTALDRQLQKLQDARRNRNPLIIAKLQDLGINITMEELTSGDTLQQTGRPHIARLLRKKGVVATFDEAFERFIGNNAPAYVDKYRIEIRDAIELIRQAGGIPVLAHPALIHPIGNWQLADLLAELQSLGLLGLEAYYPEHSAAQTQQFLALAEQHSLLVTGGTDFHGAIKPDIEMGSADGGFQVPFDVYEQLVARL